MKVAFPLISGAASLLSSNSLAASMPAVHCWCVMKLGGISP